MRIINGMGISLCLSRLLTFASIFIQHPRRHKISYMHVGWLLVVLLWIVEFWWQYFIQSGMRSHDVYAYVLDLFYVFGLFFVCVTLTPDDIADYGDYEGYFLSRKNWLFSLFIFLNMLQFLNSLKNEVPLDDDQTYLGECISFVISTAVILFSMRVRGKAFQYFLIALLIIVLLLDLTMYFD